ncbi:MAG: hypothetical protein KAW16_09300 [candidate division Zixibacteria bacterium]|nr:hypothetical protein [candidate division Zixibacteria bacterium]
MNAENELIYHEPLPRVLLIDFQRWDAEALKKSDINFKISSPTYHNLPKGRHLSFSADQKFSEIDIVFLYADYPGPEELFANDFLAGGLPGLCKQSVDFLVDRRNGFFVCFVGNNSAKSIQRFFPDVNVHNTNFKIKGTPHRFVKDFADSPFFDFVKTNFEKAKAYFALSEAAYPNKPKPPYRGRSLLVDDVGRRYVAQLDKVSSADEVKPFAIFLPVYKDTPAQVLYILEKILPKIKPSLFPNIVDFGYLSLDEFLPKELIQLKKEKRELEKGYQEKLAEYQEKEDKIKKDKEYLADLLAQKHDILKESCRKVLQEILEMVGSDLRVIDVDIEDDMKDVDRRLKDDLRIKLPDNKIILIDVKGADKTFGQGALNQLSEHRRIFQKNHKDYDIDSLGFLNHQRSVNPKNRDEIFGSATHDSLERVKSDEFAIIGTYELFKLHKALSQKEVLTNEEEVLAFLTDSGINTFEQFFKVNQK